MENNIKENNIKVKSRKSFLLFFVLVAGVCVVIIYNIILKMNIKYESTLGSLKHPDRVTLTPANSEESLADFKESAIPVDSVTENVKPQIIVSESKNQESGSEHVQKHDSASYRMFLADVNFMLVSFFQDRSYTSLIQNIRDNQVLRKERKVNNILEMFEEYNNNYLANTPSLTEPVINNSKNILNKLIKIEKTTDALKNKDILKARIIKMVDSLINFIYSQEFQNSFAVIDIKKENE